MTNRKKPAGLKERAEQDAEIYPCMVRGCKVMRSKNQGGTVFTVCDKHWDAAALRDTRKKGKG